MSDKDTTVQIPLGFKLERTLRKHKKQINQLQWSPDGRMIASCSEDAARDHTSILVWDVETGQVLQSVPKHRDAGAFFEAYIRVASIAWSPDGRILASSSERSAILLWRVKDGKYIQSLEGHVDAITYIAWSPDGRLVASSSKDGTVRIWEIQTGQTLHVLRGHDDVVTRVAWSPDGRLVASSSKDQTVRVWIAKTGQLLRSHAGSSYSLAWFPPGKKLVWGGKDNTIRIASLPARGSREEILYLEGHTNIVTGFSFSSDNHLLASISLDETIRLWRCDTWETIAVLDTPSQYENHALGLAFHPKIPKLATLGEEGTAIHIWDLDLAHLFSNPPTGSPIRYTNAKVVLVGDTGVGKSGLGLVLTGQPFVPTESTHGRRIWMFDSQEAEIAVRQRETRETLLWDLAGQPGYRLIHQLHLNEVAVALIVFDTHSETDPLAGVYHWNRAINLAQQTQGSSLSMIKKFLVAARIDRGGKVASPDRIQSLVEELGIDGYFETSAKEGKNIELLAEAIRQSIDWTTLPKVSSTQLFRTIKNFLVLQKESGLLLSTLQNLFHSFLTTKDAPAETEKLRVQFETCIGRVESRGLIRRLSLGNLVLLQPELLDAYASALVNSVKDEPDGLGSIPEEKVRAGNFFIPSDVQLEDEQQERLLLVAMVEDLLLHEIALRESADDGQYLVFPSQSTRENPDLPDPVGKAIVFRFEGPVFNIYTTLAVRLSHSGLFKKKEIWKNAITYSSKAGGICGIFLRNTGEGSGELTLFFDKHVSKETRSYFEEYVLIHLKRRALVGSIQRQRIFVCSTCETPFSDLQVTRRLELGFSSIKCSVCETDISLLDDNDRLLARAQESVIPMMNRTADTQRDLTTAAFILQSKIEIKDFDVFLCYNKEDRREVKKIGEQLKEKGILPWLDEWELQPGLPWQRLLEKQIEKIKSAAVFVGKRGIGPWQQHELDAFLREFVERGCPAIPVILAEAQARPSLPIFLKGMTWVDFRKNPDAMEQLIWGITGKRTNGF